MQTAPQPSEIPVAIPARPPAADGTPGTPGIPAPKHGGWWGTIEDQFALRQLISEYLTPVETNNFWYALGGVLAIALTCEVLTGILLTLAYLPDAGQAYNVSRTLIGTAGWSVIINFHYWNAFLIFGLVMIHMVRVLLTGGYRGGK